MKIITLEQACQECGIEKEVVAHFIQEEWIHPVNLDDFELDEEDLARIKLIKELSEDFGVNEESLPIILQLLDQLNRMHLELNKLQQEKH